MGRIRSIHPGQATDEAFVSCSFPARLLAILIRCEADDHGVFEWKPLQIKMQLFPADNVDVASLLQELSDTRQVHLYEVQHRAYGIIRNFGKWQRPRRPNYTFPLPEAGSLPAGFDLAEADGDTNVDLSGGGDDADGMTGSSTRGIPDIVRNLSADGEKEERREGKKDLRRRSSGSEPARAKPPPSYAFEGRVIRLTQADFDIWRSTFTAIPDLRAEIVAIDARFSDDPPANFNPKKWFGTASAWLRSKHERLLRDPPPKPASPNGRALL